MTDYLMPNLVKSCQVINLLNKTKEGLLATEIERELGIPRATLFRILKTLCRQEFIQKQKRCYVIGNSLIEIGLQTISESRLRTNATPILTELAHTTGYTTILAIPNHYHATILEYCESESSLKVSSALGSQSALHNSAVGKVFMAHRFADRVDELSESVGFAATTNKTLTSLDLIEEDIRRIIARGYAIEDREANFNVRALAVPVFDANGKVVASIGILAPANLFTVAQTPLLSRQVKEAARKFYYAAGLSLTGE